MSGAARRLLVMAALIAMPEPAAAGNAPALPPPARAERVEPQDLDGWGADDHLAALRVFAAGCAGPQALRAGIAAPPGLGRLCREAADLAAKASTDGGSARLFFERGFGFWRILPAPGQPHGFMTGYFEPEFPASPVPTPAFPTPLLKRPADLVTRQPGDDWPGMDPGFAAGRRVGERIEPFPDRAAIEDGALSGQGLEWLWLRDSVDRFVLQVQGSGRLRLTDGRLVRLVYAGRNGHPYTSLGRLLSVREGIPPADMTMDRLVARLKADAAFARALIRENRSFVFFDEAPGLSPDAGPIGGAGLSLTPLRSLAADRAIWPYGLPAWLDGTIPGEDGAPARLARLGVIQDTGSAIVGPARIDLFVGSGAAAGHRAGLIRHPFAFTLLWPRGEAP